MSTQIGVLNAAKLVNMRDDPLLRGSVLSSDICVADGQSVVWASHLLGQPLPERVAGIDLFEALMEEANARGLRVYLLGAAQSVLDALLDEVAARWPGAVVAGSHHGFFTDEEAPTVAASIAASQADMLFVGITSPKKEIFIDQFGPVLQVPLLHGVGGSFDVLAGQVRRAPRPLQRLGLEWAFRLAQEPRRLWRRYLRTNAAFSVLCLSEMLGRFTKGGRRA